MKKITSFFQPKKSSAKQKRGLTGEQEDASREKQDETTALTTGESSAKRLCTDAVEALLAHLIDETGGWKKALQKQFQSSNFRSLARYVAKERRDRTVYPTVSNTWTALNCTPLEQVKVVIVGQDPYHGQNQAHGLCFSVLPGNAAPPSLKNIYKELADDPGVQFPRAAMPKHGHLIRWAEHGVLLLNTVLTVRRGEANSHQKRGWEAVTDAIIRAVDRQHGAVNGKGCVFLLWGKPATTKAVQLISKNSIRKHVVITTSHPSPLGARKTSQPFLGSRCFSRCNAALVKMGREPIDWNVD